MSAIRYAVSGGLSDAQIGMMHAAALRVLHEVGVEVEFPEILSAISGQRGVGIQGSRVRLDPDMVDGFVSEYRKARGPAQSPSDDFRIDILTGYAFNIIDDDDARLRPMTTRDCIEMAKLVDGLHGKGVAGGTPGMPQDVPVQLREVLAYKIGREYCRTACDVGITSLAAAEAMRRMAAACGMPFGLPIFVPDPLRIAGDSVAMSLHFLRMKDKMPLGFSSMPLFGLTCPLRLPGAFVENIATVLGTFSVFKLMGLDNELRYHFDVYPFDMRTGSVAYGTPEHVLMQLVGRQVNDYYAGDSSVCKAFHTNAVFPNAHSMAQRAAGAATLALAGARSFTFGGMLGIDKVFSAAQLLIDVEIVSYVKTICMGFDFTPESLCSDAIAEIGPGGEFITHPTTVESFRNLWASKFFENIAPEAVAPGSRDNLWEKLREEVKGIISRHDFELDTGQKHEMDAIYDGFCKTAI
ncbi:MAG TPA: trimethylamine methyltransferase family protein [Candidatus Brocadiia bacterium]|nr:trimethylamine methyltransferase family protein [Candidatus Brocadiia bacterium]